MRRIEVIRNNNTSKYCIGEFGYKEIDRLNKESISGIELVGLIDYDRIGELGELYGNDIELSDEELKVLQGLFEDCVFRANYLLSVLLQCYDSDAMFLTDLERLAKNKRLSLINKSRQNSGLDDLVFSVIDSFGDGCVFSATDVKVAGGFDESLITIGRIIKKRYRMKSVRIGQVIKKMYVKYRENEEEYDDWNYDE